MANVAKWHEQDDDSGPPEVAALLGGIKRAPKKPAPLSAQDVRIDEEDEDDEMSKGSKLPMSSKLIYGLPHFATAAMYLPTTIHVSKFFADTLLVAPGTLALATAVARAVDTMLGPFFGWLSDSTSTKWGRRKPYLAAGAPLSACFYLLLFTPPLNISPSHAAIWFCVFYALFLTVPLSLCHEALGPELTQDYRERSSLYAWSEVFTMTGVIIAAAAPGIMSQFISDQRVVFFSMALVVSCLLVASYSLLCYFLKEPEQVVQSGNPLIPGIRRAWRNYPFRMLVTTHILLATAHHASNLMFPFYVSYVLHPDNDALWLSICLLCYFGSSAVSIPMWCALSHVWDKKNVWLLTWAIYLPVAFFMFFLQEGAVVSLILVTCGTGVAYGGTSYLNKAIHADVIDYDELVTTKRREGQYITVWFLIPKLVSIPAFSIPLVVMQAAGYEPNRHPQTQEVVMTIRILTSLLPFLLSVVAFAIALQYPIDRATNRAIHSMIARRRKAIRDQTPMPQETDPVTGEDLPQITGGLTLLNAEFCWYLDHFSEEELRLVLRKGQRALILRVYWGLYAALALALCAALCIWIGGVGLKVFGIMGVSISVALFVFELFRLRAAYEFDTEKIRTFRKGKDEFFRVMANSRYTATKAASQRQSGPLSDS